ncbi:hypothetical protein [Streptomyces sp. Ncost-T6T-1]|uniref:hypothetical protein n=1 Tax=Streptomyces sp. Ncost-T6T-1 TaxID=1100828 RepID=UPI0011469FBC|nr:hypothetical protein [Streptomyces sp. Ncost-T6T-1]
MNGVGTIVSQPGQLRSPAAHPAVVTESTCQADQFSMSLPNSWHTASWRKALPYAATSNRLGSRSSSPLFLLLGIAVLSASPIGHAGREEQVAKHARPRQHKKKKKEVNGRAQERRERATLMIRIAVLICAIARSCSGD